METCREYPFNGFIWVGHGEEVEVSGNGWINEDGTFGFSLDRWPDERGGLEDQIFELFQIQNRGRLPQVCIERFESAPLADQEPNHNPNSAIGR